jgi:hypothetical protein
MEWQRGSVTMWQHNALLTPYTCLAPAFAANIERIPVPQPTSSTTLPLNASLLMCETLSRVNSKLTCPSCVLHYVQSQHIACSPCVRVQVRARVHNTTPTHLLSMIAARYERVRTSSLSISSWMP